MAGLPVVAGPLDGIKAKAIGGKFVWLDEQGGASRTPTKGGHVYIRESTRYRFAGHAHRVCRCGAHLEPVRIKAGPPRPPHYCRLCGEPTSKQPRRS